MSGSEGEGAGKKKLPTFTWEEVAKHNTGESLWLVVHDKVYDVTSFMDEVSGRVLEWRLSVRVLCVSISLYSILEGRRYCWRLQV